MASLTTDESSSVPLIAQETGQVHTVNHRFRQPKSWTENLITITRREDEAFRIMFVMPEPGKTKAFEHIFLLYLRELEEPFLLFSYSFTQLKSEVVWKHLVRFSFPVTVLGAV